MFYKKLLYYAKSIREKNSLRNLWRYFDFMIEKSAQPWNIQVNVDTGDGRLFRINDISFGKMDKSVHLHIDPSQPMSYPGFGKVKNENQNQIILKMHNEERQAEEFEGATPRQRDENHSEIA